MDGREAQPSPEAGMPTRTLELEALKAMAHPLRVKIFDILSQYGPQTSSSLAQQLGESSGATSYHLRQLARHGLIREVEGRGTARERWWERPPGGINMMPPEVMETPAGRQAARMVLHEYLLRRNQQLTRFFVHDFDDEPEDWQEVSLFSTTNLWLSPEQLHELEERWNQLSEEYVVKYRNQRGEGVRPVTVHLNAFPLPEQPEDA